MKQQFLISSDISHIFILKQFFLFLSWTYVTFANAPEENYFESQLVLTASS